MNVLLLGGTGAMGTPLAHILSDKGYKVDITSRTDHMSDNAELVHFIKGDGHDDVLLSAVLRQKHYDAIVDFLKYTPEQFAEKILVLLDGTDQYFLLSSCRVYADSHIALKEDDIRLLDANIDEADFATEMYALTKAREENILKNTGRNNWTIIRPYLTYNDYRLQLGFYEKEHWLNRALMNKALLFPMTLMEKRTTLTHGRDVANIIALLIGKSDAMGAVFNLTSTESHTWHEVIQLYSNTLFSLVGLQMNIRYVDDIGQFYKFWPFSLISYDRCYDRVFDNQRLLSVIGNYDFVALQDGINSCISSFIRKPIWQSYFTRYEAWSDKILKEYTPLAKIPGKRSKIRYLIDRFL